MVKKAVVIAAGVLLLVGLLYGRSHVSTAVGIAQDAIGESVPIPFKIERARKEIKRLHYLNISWLGE